MNKCISGGSVLDFADGILFGSFGKDIQKCTHTGEGNMDKKWLNSKYRFLNNFTSKSSEFPHYAMRVRII